MPVLAVLLHEILDTCPSTLQYSAIRPPATSMANTVLHSGRLYLSALATAGVPSYQHARVGGYGSHDRVLVGCDGQRGTVAPDFDHLGQASSHTEVDKCLLGACVGRVINFMFSSVHFPTTIVVCVFLQLLLN